MVHEADYKYDRFLKVYSQQKQFLQRNTTGALLFSGCTPQSATATETYAYDELQRLTSGSRAWTGLTPGSGTSNAYDEPDANPVPLGTGR